MRRQCLLLLPIGLLVIAMSNCAGDTKTKQMQQPQLGTRGATLIERDGLKFKDLNKNGKVDDYEDWRLPPAQRSKDLLQRMSLAGKAGMMLIADMRMANEAFMLEGTGPTEPVTSDFNEEDIVVDKNQFTGEPLPYPIMNTVGTTKGVRQHKMRHFIWRTTSAPADTMARWANKVQALAEGDSLGIPVLFASNPRNHLTGGSTGATASASVGFSKWPSEIGLAAMRDSAMVHQFADMARQEWLAAGIRKRRQKNERNAGFDGVFAQDVQHAVAIQPGHHDVAQNEVGVGAAGQFDALFAV
jgi:beta-glucosidase